MGSEQTLVSEKQIGLETLLLRKFPPLEKIPYVWFPAAMQIHLAKISCTKISLGLIRKNFHHLFFQISFNKIQINVITEQVNIFWHKSIFKHEISSEEQESRPSDDIFDLEFKTGFKIHSIFFSERIL